MCWHVLFWRPLCVKEEVQWVQWKGFSPEWVSMRLLRIYALVEEYLRLFYRVDLHVDSKPASLIQRVVPLWTNKQIISAVNSHVGFQIGNFGTRVAALIAIVIFLCIRLNLVDFGYLEKFLFMICVFSVCWRLQSIGITEKNKVIWSGPFHEVARCNDDNDDDDDRNIYLRNEYL